LSGAKSWPYVVAFQLRSTTAAGAPALARRNAWICDLENGASFDVYPPSPGGTAHVSYTGL
jgi:hypothetical protein